MPALSHDASRVTPPHASRTFAAALAFALAIDVHIFCVWFSFESISRKISFARAGLPAASMPTTGRIFARTRCIGEQEPIFFAVFFAASNSWRIIAAGVQAGHFATGTSRVSDQRLRLRAPGAAPPHFPMNRGRAPLTARQSVIRFFVQTHPTREPILPFR
jgi:hypothetical protein